MSPALYGGLLWLDSVLTRYSRQVLRNSFQFHTYFDSIVNDYEDLQPVMVQQGVSFSAFDVRLQEYIAFLDKINRDDKPNGFRASYIEQRYADSESVPDVVLAARPVSVTHIPAFSAQLDWVKSYRPFRVQDVGKRKVLRSLLALFNSHREYMDMNIDHYVVTADGVVYQFCDLRNETHDDPNWLVTLL